ncbi:ATPase [Flexivirga sp. B27]
MTIHDSLTATLIIDSAADTVFTVLADPSTHAAVDGTGWVVGPVDPEPLTAVGQVFRMNQYFDNPALPDGNYRTANTVNVLDEPRAIGWEPGQQRADGGVDRGGWTWRYDLVPVDGNRTEVTLTYDWSQVSPELRTMIAFPAADLAHLQNSLQHLADLATGKG